jgi:type I restriction enzyme, S subunit
VIGTTNSHQRVRKSDLIKFRIPNPSKSNILKIGEIHRNLRESLMLSRQNSERIKKIIWTIFRSWFIDFDPVKAKVKGQLPYGMDEKTAALFPDTFEDSELGLIPTGWNVGRIGDIADISSGKHQPERAEQISSEYDIPLLGGAGIIAWTVDSLFNEPIIVMGRVGTLGVIQKYTIPVWPSDNTLIFKTLNNSSFHYLFHQLKLQDFGAYNRGSTQPLLTQSDMKKLKIIIPNNDILLVFEEKIRSMVSLSRLIEEQNKFLTETRETLLPRLMSGELKVN